MKKMLALLLAGLTIFTVPYLPAQAASGGLSDGFEVYETFQQILNVWKASASKDTTGGSISFESVMDASGASTKAAKLAVQANTNPDPYIQCDALDVSGETVTSFDIMVTETTKQKQYVWREGTSAGTSWLYPFEINGTAIKSFGTVIGTIDSAGSPYQSNQWLHVKLVTTPEIGTTNITYSVFLNGQPVVSNQLFTGSKKECKYSSIGVRLCLTGAAVATDSKLYLDNFYLSKTANMNLNAMTSVPANNQTNVAVSQNTVDVDFNALMDATTLIPENITVNKEYEGDITTVTGSSLLKGPGNVRIILPESKLDQSTKYSISFSEAVHDANGNAISEALRTISFTTIDEAAEAYEAVFREETFFSENFNGTSLPDGFGYATNGNGSVTSQSVDAAHGNSAKITVNKNTATGGPYLGREFSATDVTSMNGATVTLQADIFMTDTLHNLSVFTVRQAATSTLWDTEVAFMPGGNISLLKADGSSAQTVMAYEPGKWYTLKQVMNFKTKTFDLYIDGVKKVTARSFVTPSITAIPHVRITLNSPVDTEGVAYVDNFMAGKSVEVPGILSMKFLNSRDILKSKTAPLDTKEIVVYFSRAMNEADMTPEHIVLGQTLQGIPVATDGFYDSANNAYHIKLLTPLTSGTNYTVMVDEKVRSADGVMTKMVLSRSFPVAPGEFGAQNIKIMREEDEITKVSSLQTGDTIHAQVQIVNQTQSIQSAAIVLAMYQNGEMVKAMVKSNAAIDPGTTVVISTGSFEANVSGQTELRVFVWNTMQSRQTIMEHKLVK